MRLLHISDLHIGRRLNGISLLEDQRQVLAQLTALAEGCDAVLLCGDLFDKAQPSQEALQTVGGFLVTLSRLHKPAFVISGNHDSGEQLAYCRELMEPGGVFVAPPYRGELVNHILHDEYGPVCFWLLPFIKPASLRPYAPEVSTYDEAVRAALANAPVDPTRRNVLLAHQFVTGAAVCDSEGVSVGGLEQIGADAFSVFDYVALGHLHSPQRLAGGRVCYCGSPQKYSLSEEKQKKAAFVVTLGEKGSLTVEPQPISPPRDLRVLRGTFNELTHQRSDDYVYAVLTDEGALLDPAGALRLSFPNLLGLRVENSRTGDDGVFADIESAEALSPLEHFVAFYRAQHNDQPPDSRRMNVLREVLAQAQSEGGGHETD